MGLFDKALEAQNENDMNEEDRKLVGHIRSQIEEIRVSANRVAHEGMWMTNIAYILGFDGISFNTTNRSFQPINQTSKYLKKNRIHVNKILPNVQNRLARLCKNPPRYDIRPESNDTDDKEAARLAVQVLTSLWERLSLDQKRIHLYMWLQETGHSYMKVSWDPSLGKEMVDPMTGEMSYEGDVCADVVSSFEVFTPPSSKTFDEVKKTWLIQCKVRKLDYFKIHYPEKGHLVKEEEVWLLSSQYEQRINSLNARGPSTSGMQEAMKNSAIEMVKYEARSKDYPNGRMIVCANGILLDNKELPVGEIPFEKFDDTVIAGKYFSETPVTHARPVQDQYNETIRRRAEWTKRLLAGKYVAARGSGLSQESMNDESGEIVYFTPVPSAPNGGMPTELGIPNIPQYAYTEEDRLNNMFNEIFGISDVSKGEMPSASIPAIGMQLLTEQDDTRIGIMTEQHEHAWANIGSLILKYVEFGYDMPRKLKIAGTNLAYTVKEITGEDLKGNTDVYVIRGSTLPGSKTLKRQEILNTYSQGLLGDPNDPKVKEHVLNMIEFGDVGEMWQDYGIDMAQIKRGMESLQIGRPVPVDDFDNHTLWIQEINRFRKGDKFPTLDPQVQNLLIQTMHQHADAVLKITAPPPPPPPPDIPQPEASDLDQLGGGAPPPAMPPGPTPPPPEGM